MRDTDVPVEKPDVEIDLRTDGIIQDTVENEESWITHKVCLRRPEEGQHDLQRGDESTFVDIRTWDRAFSCRAFSYEDTCLFLQPYKVVFRARTT